MTATPTPTPTPYYWPTPTAWPTSDAYLLDVPPVNPILVKAAEETVQVYNTANRYQLMDTMITLILIVMIIGAGIRFYWKMRKVGGNNDD